MNRIEPDLIVQVRFKTPEEGGRTSPVSGGFYGCPFIVDDEWFDCRLLLSDLRIQPGQTYEVPVKFLNWQLVSCKVYDGKVFALWDGKEVATGKVLRVMRK